MFPVIDWISDTLSLSCRAWQNAWIIIVEMLHQIWYAVQQGCAMQWNTSRRLYLQSWRVELLAEKLLRQQLWRLLLTVGARLTVPTAGHKREHNAHT